MKNFSKDRWLGIGVLVLSIICVVAIQQFPDPVMNVTGDPGARLFPTFGVILMAIGGAGLIFQKNQNTKAFMEKAEYKRLLLLTVTLVVYAAALYLAGFLLSTVVMLWVVMGFMAGDKKLKMIIRAPYSLIVTAVLYLAFTNILHYQLPAGLIFSLF